MVAGIQEGLSVAYGAHLRMHSSARFKRSIANSHLQSSPVSFRRTSRSKALLSPPANGRGNPGSRNGTFTYHGVAIHGDTTGFSSPGGGGQGCPPPPGSGAPGLGKEGKIVDERGNFVSMVAAARTKLYCLTRFPTIPPTAGSEIFRGVERKEERVCASATKRWGTTSWNFLCRATCANHMNFSRHLDFVTKTGWFSLHFIE